MKKLDTTKRKALLAAGAEFLKSLSEIDEIEAETVAAKRALEAAQAELAETQSRLEASKAELVRADAEHSKWRDATAKERTKGNAKIDALQQELRTLEEAVTERRQEVNSVLAGMSALRSRLKVAE
jgi:hypothetical protein